MTPLQIILVIYGLIGLALLWLGIFHLTAYLSGWKLLALEFQETNPFIGTEVLLWHARMRSLAKYDLVIYMGADAQGLHLRVNLLFRIAHPPLLIPWSEVSIGPESRGLFFIPVTVLLLGRESQIPLKIWGWKARNLLQASPIAEKTPLAIN